jgi:hypothetical protein
MKSIRSFVAASLLGAAMLAGAQVNLPNPNTPGGSMNTAVRIVATNDLMIDRVIARWLRTHYPGWDPDPHEFQEIGHERYAVVYITHSDHPGRRVYFRIQKSYAEPDEGPAFPN